MNVKEDLDAEEDPDADEDQGLRADMLYGYVLDVTSLDSESEPEHEDTTSRL